MTITDQTATALSDYLRKVLTLASTVDNGIRTEAVGQFDNRVVVVGDQGALRHPYVQGMYDINGTVVVQQSIDSEDAAEMFRSLSEEVRAALEDKANMPVNLQAEAPALRVHTWNFTTQEALSSDRGMQTTFSWDVFAELPHA